jgi:uncharacterized protein YqeY
MSLMEKINSDLIVAMKTKNESSLRAIRAVKSALLILKTESSGKEISEEEENKLLQRLVKQRKESYEVFTSQNRNDLAATEMEELLIIESYLPKQMAIEEVETELKVIIKESGAASIADIGKVMPLAMKKFAGKADGKTISEVLKRLLSSI